MRSFTKCPQCNGMGLKSYTVAVSFSDKMTEEELTCEWCNASGVIELVDYDRSKAYMRADGQVVKIHRNKPVKAL